MNCEKVSNLLSAYLDNELAPDEQRLVRAHLVTCAECSQEYEELESVKMKLASLMSYEVPEDLFAEVSVRLAAEDAAARPIFGDLRRFGYWPAAAAAAVLVAFMVSTIHPATVNRVVEPGAFFRQHGLTTASQPLADNSLVNYYLASAESSGGMHVEVPPSERVKLIGQIQDFQ